MGKTDKSLNQIVRRREVSPVRSRVTGMKVFLSSVGRTLQAERDGLAAQLQVMAPYEPLRFEDFTAQDRSSREACLAGVDACDVYILILGPRYGEPLPDTDKAPTEEEFEHARRTGKPILVFTKDTSDPDEPRQTGFKARVEDYVDGYFRRSFTDVLGLNVAVTKALGDLPSRTALLRWTDLSTPAAMVWRWDVPQIGSSSSAPVLDVHLIPLDGGQLRATRMSQLPNVLTRAARDAGLFTETDPVEAGNTAELAWTTSRTSSSTSRGFGIPHHNERWRGVLVHRTGQVSVFESLPADWIGALVNEHDLQQRLSWLLVAAAAHLSPQVADAAVAASLGPLAQVSEGDPSQVGVRTSGSMGLRRPGAAVMHPKHAVPVAGLKAQPGDVAAELAAELISTIRDDTP